MALLVFLYKIELGYTISRECYIFPRKIFDNTMICFLISINKLYMKTF